MNKLAIEQEFSGRGSCDPTRHYHGENKTSNDAWDRIKGRADADRKRIVEFLRRKGPAMCEQVEKALDLKHQTASARLTQLLATGEVWICGHGETSSGSSARIYQAVDGRPQLKLL